MSDATDDLEMAEYFGTTTPVRDLDTPRCFWTTRDGVRLNIEDMETSHIKNCIRMLQKQIIDPWTIHGDEPKYGAGGGMDTMLHEQNEKFEQSIKRFERILSKRGEL